MSASKHRNSSRVMALITRMLAESGTLSKSDIRARLNLYGGTVVNSGINYLLLSGRIVERQDGQLEITKLENENATRS